MIMMTDGKPGEGMTYRDTATNHFPARLRQIRKGLKLNQSAMAECIGVGLSTLQRYEKGSSYPTTDVLERVAALGVDLHFLITGSFAENSACVQAKPGVVYFAFRSDRFKQIEETLQQAGMTIADLYFVMDHHLRGIVDGLKYLNEKASRK